MGNGKREARNEKRAPSPFNGPVAKLYSEIRISTFFSQFVRSLALTCARSLFPSSFVRLVSPSSMDLLFKNACTIALMF